MVKLPKIPPFRNVGHAQGDDSVGRDALQLLSPKANAAVMAQKSRDRPEGGSFPGSICTDQSEDLSFKDFERNALHRMDVAIGNLQILDRKRAHSSVSPR